MTDALSLRDEVNRIKGIGPKKNKALRDIGINKVVDLLSLYPVKYDDRRKLTYINNLKPGENLLIECTLVNVRLDSKGYNKKSGRVRIIAEDKTGKIVITYFNGGYLINNFKKGDRFTFYGKAEKAYGKIPGVSVQMINPAYAKAGSEDDIRGIAPLYKTGRDLSQNDVKKWVKLALTLIDQYGEWIPSELISKHNLCSLSYAVNNIHYPKDEISYKAAKYRLLYGQFLRYQLSAVNSIEMKAVNSAVEDVDIKPYLESLEFKMTDDQIKCVGEIENDLIIPKPMNRLLQGDVGSGKTAVAAAAIYKTVLAGHQAAYMAPTELLAKQIYKSIEKVFKPLGIKIYLYLGSSSKAERQEILEAMESGEGKIVVGTHTLIQKAISFNDLLLVITDEQHRFGVNQRKELKDKGKAANVLVMTATPIPRTLAATVYGDLDFSVIKTMPKGRKQIVTTVCDETTGEKAYVSLEKELEKGYQAYVVAPLIDESSESELNSATELFGELKKRYGKYKLGLLHGKLSADEKNRLMADFLAKRIDVLVSTVIIEVGIDVPNATVMIIENAERFGLAQLHQLRGRVGRSDVQSYCFLISHSKSDIAVRRMNAMKNHASGFDISEEDFKLRGPGDINSTMQHGNALEVNNFIRYIEILEKAGEDAKELVKKGLDDTLKNEVTEFKENGLRNVI